MGLQSQGNTPNKGTTEVVGVRHREYKPRAPWFSGARVIKLASKAHLVHYVISLVCE